MNTPALILRPLSEHERAAWREHNLQTLRESAGWCFEEKLRMLEEMEETVLALGYQRDPATGRLFHPEKSRLPVPPLEPSFPPK